MERGMLTLGLDIGTTSSKAVVLDEGSRAIASARVEHDAAYPRPGFVEQDAETWIRDIGLLVGSLRRSIDIGRLGAVGVSSMGPTVVAVSERGEPTRPAILYGVDTRAVRQIERLNDSLRDLLMSRAFSLFTSQSMLPKILWVKENEPVVYARTRHFLTTNGYVVERLTGTPVADFFSASAGTLVDFTRTELFRESFAEAGIEPRVVPELRWPAEVAGVVTSEGSAATGLPAGIPVTVGTTDAAAEALVCGCARAGDCALSLGGTTIAVACSDTVRPLPNLFACSYLSPGHYILGGATASGGLAVEWLAREVLGKDGAEALHASFPGVAYRPVSALVLPYLNGARTPLNDPRASAMIAGLTATSGAEEIYIALLESLALDTSLIVEEIERCGQPVGQVRVTGGGTRNPVLMEILAEVLGRDVGCLTPVMGAAAGAALLARVAMGGGSLEDVSRSVPVNRQVSRSGRYDAYLREKRALFSEAYRANRDLFARISTLSSSWRV